MGSPWISATRRATSFFVSVGTRSVVIAGPVMVGVWWRAAQCAAGASPDALVRGLGRGRLLRVTRVNTVSVPSRHTAALIAGGQNPQCGRPRCGRREQPYPRYSFRFRETQG